MHTYFLEHSSDFGQLGRQLVEIFMTQVGHFVGVT